MKEQLKPGQKVYLDNYVNEFTVIKTKRHRVELEYYGEETKQHHRVEVKYDQITLI